jgi:hypothetical protein
MRILLLLVVLPLTLTTIHAGVIMYGGNGGHPNPDGSPLSINNGWLDIIDQTTGAVTPVGHPAGVAKLSGLAFRPAIFCSAVRSTAILDFRLLCQISRRRTLCRSTH